MKPKNPNKILIVSPAWVGDLVMSQVLLKLIKQRDPDAMIDVLAPEWGRALLQRMPEVNDVHTMPIGHGQFQFGKRWELGRRLAREAYSQAILLPNSWKSALIPFIARIPRRTGWLGEQRYGLLNDVRYLNKEQLPLMIQRFSALGLAKGESLPAVLPKPRLHVARDSVTTTLAKFKLKAQQPILALCPGAEYGPAKRWPAEYFAEVAQHKLGEGWNVWIFGSHKDQAIAHEIQQVTGDACEDLTGKTSLGEAVDLLAQANTVLTNDSGLMHVSAALDRPLVAIYGSSSAKFTPPLSDKAKMLSLGLACSPCFKRECPLHHLQCLRELHPELVLKVMDGLN